MSAKATFWAWDQSKNLTSTELLVLLSLANFANEENQLWYSYKKIADATQLSRRTVIKVCRDLEDRSILFVERRQKCVTQNDTNLFTILVPNVAWGGELKSLGVVNVLHQGGERAAPKSNNETNNNIYIYTPSEISIDLPPEITHEQFNQFIQHRADLKKVDKRKKLNQRVAQLGLTQMLTLIRQGEDLSACLNQMELKGWDQPYANNKIQRGGGNEKRQPDRKRTAREILADEKRQFEERRRAKASAMDDDGSIEGEFFRC